MQRSKQNTESPIKELCWDCGHFGCLIGACIVARFSFLTVRMLSLPQQTSQRAMLFRVSMLFRVCLLMGSSTIHSLTVCPVWDTWSPIFYMPRWASAQLNTVVCRGFWNRKRDVVAFYIVKWGQLLLKKKWMYYWEYSVLQWNKHCPCLDNSCFSLIMAACPDLTICGLTSRILLVRQSIFSKSSANLQAMCAVWQSRRVNSQHGSHQGD